MKTAGISGKMAMDATDLTQLSSREQLSALMDGALPADETRFLLRRLQHDDSLAECWERWRLSAEVMRGLAPAQRLPADFASRVAAALRGEDQHGGAAAETVATGKHAVRTPAWLRWGGGAAMAASLAIVAFMTQPVALEAPGKLPDNMVVAVTDTAPSLASDAAALSKLPAPKAPAPRAPAQDPAGASVESQTAALASAVAAIARPARNNRRGHQANATQAASMLTAANDKQSIEVGIATASNIPSLLPQADIITRPWPRSVFPHDGSTGITVGFGDSARNTAPYNPFQMRKGIGNLPPVLLGQPSRQDATPPADNREGSGTNGVAENELPQS
jgi:negative regulator of sigma E activity